MNRRVLTTGTGVVALVALLLVAVEPAAAQLPPGTYPFAFTDAGDSAGLFPHVGSIWGHGAAWGDVDGDGRIELYVATFHILGSKPNLFFRNKPGKFELDPQQPLAVSTRGTGVLFADLDNDGDLDLYLGNMPDPANNQAGCSLLLHNETPGGHRLRVQVEGTSGVNRMGVGSRVNLYAEGKLGQPSALIGCREIATGYGYASGQPASAHFGLGPAQKVDVEVVLPHGKGKLTQTGVPANQVLKVRQ
ncbi:MAG: CRTAC1 family protein [Planctomycetales bacterium]